ncbi:MAG TPA: 3D domain-containing protein [Luteolibacter sp.]|nr:3D domain-containing protein [Luteolibacter sp.]
MSLRPLILPLLGLMALGICSCHNPGGPLRENYTNLAPSREVVAAGRAKPKDRHGMPIYTYGQKLRHARTTAYTCTELDHLQYGSKTAFGTQLRYGQRMCSAAADWSFYPLGTTFRIKGMPQLFIIDDYGSALLGTATVDLYKPNHELVRMWGVRKVELTVVQWGSMRRSAETLAQRTRYRHCRLMLENILRQQPALRSQIKR